MFLDILGSTTIGRVSPYIFAQDRHDLANRVIHIVNDIKSELRDGESDSATQASDFVEPANSTMDDPPSIDRSLVPQPRPKPETAVPNRCNITQRPLRLLPPARPRDRRQRASLPISIHPPQPLADSGMRFTLHQWQDPHTPTSVLDPPPMYTAD